MKKKMFLVAIILAIYTQCFCDGINELFSYGSDYDFITLTKYENCKSTEPSTFLQILTCEPGEREDIYYYCSVFTEDLSKEKYMKKLAAELTKQKIKHEYLKKTKLKQTLDDVFFENNFIFYCYKFEIE